MRTPSRASISTCSRGIVQLRRSATGCSSKGVTTRKAASLFTGAGPGATLAFSPSTPPRTKSLRHRRTVSSRTPNASAIRGLVQPASVNSTERALSASPRSREAPQRRSLLLARRQQRLARHVQPPANHRSSRYSESQPASVGEPDEVCLVAEGWSVGSRGHGVCRSCRQRRGEADQAEAPLDRDMVLVAERRDREVDRRHTPILTGFALEYLTVQRASRSFCASFAGECQESCARGHSRGKGARIWRSRRTPWTNFCWGATRRRCFSKDGLFDELKKALAERMLNAELDDHLDNEAAEGSRNRRNGSWKKTVLRKGLGTAVSVIKAPSGQRHKVGVACPVME